MSRFGPQRKSKKGRSTIYRHHSVRRSDRLRTRDHVGRELVQALDQGLHLLAADKVKLQIDFLRFSDQVRVVHGLSKALTQGCGDGRIEAGRRQQRSPHRIPREDELKYLPVSVAFDEVS